MSRTERPRLDGTDAVVCPPGADDALRDTWLGHAPHPLLTDFRLGAWMSASFLDLFGGSGAAGRPNGSSGGYFGGHLSLVRKIGTTDAAFGPDGEVFPA